VYKKKLLRQKKISLGVGAVTYYEKTTQYKGSRLFRKKNGLLGSGASLLGEGRFDLESGDMGKYLQI